MKKESTINIITAILALLFFYAAISKLLDYDTSRHEMLSQVFPRAVALQLVWAIPCIEVLIMLGLLINSSRLKAMYASVLLLLAFSLYITITMSGIFGRIPCSCGGILKYMGYWTHLAFNIFFIAIAVLGIALEKQWKPINIWFDFAIRKEGTGF